MAEKSVPGSSVIWIVVVALLAAYAWWLSGQLDASQERLEAAQQRERQLILQIQEMAVRPGTQECPPAP